MSEESKSHRLLEMHEEEKRPFLSPKARKEIWDWVKAFVVALAIVLLVRTFLFTFIRVDGNSMLETLHNDDRLFVTRLDMRLHGPDRFDVVIVHYPNKKDNYVKRIIGLPGDTLEVRSGRLYINGEEYEEAFLDPDIAAGFSRSTYDFGPIVVPEDSYFVMGDNRVNSNDSRNVGPITSDMVLGKVRYILFPFNRIGAVPGSEVYAEQ